MKKIIAGFVAGGLCVGLVGCSASKAPASQDVPAVAVKVVDIAKSTMDTYARNSAKITPYQEIMIVPKVSGTVETVNFDIGQKISAGEVLFTIDDVDISLQTAQAEAGYLAAKANYDRTVGGGARQQLLQLQTAVNTTKVNLDDATLALARTQELFAIGAASQQALEAAQSRYALSEEQYQSASDNLALTNNQLLGENKLAVEASLKQAKAAYDMAQRQLQNTVVVSDIDGIVGMSTLSVGAVVGPQSPVMSVIDISKVVLEFGVSDSIINAIKAEQTKVEIEISALGGKTYQGVVSAVAPTADAKTMTYQVKVEIENADQSIKPGMFASIKIILQTIEDVIAVPCNAVFEKNGKTNVYVVQDNKAVLREVVVGISNESDTQINEGLQEGEAVVIEGQSLLEDGLLVSVVKE